MEKRAAEEARDEEAEFTIFPRFHQSRMVRNVCNDALRHFVETGEIGRKYLINHSAGSGKTLSICWLADRLHSLYHPATNEKMVNIVVVLTDRQSLDKNIRDDIEKFSHLKDLVRLTNKSADLVAFLNTRAQIIVTTIQKFKDILDQIEANPELKKLRIAFLIDEAHRSQQGKMGVAIRLPFRDPSTPDMDEEESDIEDQEEAIARIIHEHDRNRYLLLLQQLLRQQPFRFLVTRSISTPRQKQ